jgi:hypothetical protein
MVETGRWSPRPVGSLDKHSSNGCILQQGLDKCEWSLVA